MALGLGGLILVLVGLALYFFGGEIPLAAPRLLGL